MSERTYTDADGRQQPDRRSNERLRVVFERACELVTPFFDARQGWGGHSLEHLAFRVLRENFPDLSMGEVEVVVATAHRVYVSRQGEPESSG